MSGKLEDYLKSCSVRASKCFVCPFEDCKWSYATKLQNTGLRLSSHNFRLEFNCLGISKMNLHILSAGKFWPNSNYFLHQSQTLPGADKVNQAY